MPQITKGDTFADGQQVTGARLNQLVDSATILPAIITDQTNLTANTVATGDSVLLYDASATALREATASDLLNSNIAVTTSSITGGANSDIVITPNDGATVTGATYTSGDGLTVVVTLNSHGLAINQVVTISGAGSGYNGTFRITAVDANTFTYVMTTAATPATNQSCSYTRQGTIRNQEHAVISGNLYVNGDVNFSGTSNVIGDVINDVKFTSTGAVKIPVGTTAQRPSSPVSGQTRLNTTLGVLETYNGTTWGVGVGLTTTNTLTGTNDFTGGIKVDGTTGFMLYEVKEEAISNYVTSWTSQTFSKPSNEIWLLSFNVTFFSGTSSNTTLTVSTTSGTTLTSLWFSLQGTSSNSSANLGTLVLNAGKENISDNIIMSLNNNGRLGASGQSLGMKMVVMKYKTATGNLVGKTTALNYTNNGTSATITSAGHGLASGAYVNVFASNPLISGRYQITSTTIDTFTYSNTTAAGSGTCSYFA